MLVAIKASFLQFDLCNICKNNIAKKFLFFSKFKIFDLLAVFLIFCKKSFGPDQINVLVVRFPYPNYPESEF